MKKRVLRRVIVACLSVTLLSGTLGSITTHAMNEDELVTQTRVLEKQKEIQRMKDQYGHQYQYNAKLLADPLKNVVYNNAQVELIDYTSSSAGYAFLGSSILENKTSQTGDYFSLAFTHQQAQTTTSTTTNKVGVGLKASAGFNIELVKASVEVNTNYEFSKADTNSTTVTKTINIPSTKFTLAPGSAVKVTANLQLYTVNGRTKLNAGIKGTDVGIVERYQVVNGQDRFMIYSSFAYPIQEHAKALGMPLNADGSVQINGYGTFKVDVGADVVISATDVKSGELVASKTFKVKELKQRSSDGNIDVVLDGVGADGVIDFTK